ncbi:hypothetical protein [Brevibacillus sp. Leaf182]|uniref:hypothetical protein n=1 Tax=Brevibacillus sp. Leaf182 TaxID=1736290 RepID=UPI0006F5DD05|nr:hypothetical protein [Brevibacillus sp. Leaf182]RAT95809.1 hypothetical protein ASG16_021100 [Brevibacillus sp. Leaf182]
MLKKVTYTSHHNLGQVLPFNYKQHSKNAEVAKEIMQSLKVKGAIDYVEPADNHSLITVQIEEVKYVKDDIRTVYQAVGSDIIETTNDPYELYVLITVRRFNLMDKSGELGYPYYRNKKRWGSLLDCDNRTAYEIIERMINKKILYWYERDKSFEDGKWNQRDGMYFIYPQEKRVRAMKISDKGKRTHMNMLIIKMLHQKMNKLMIMRGWMNLKIRFRNLIKNNNSLASSIRS